MSFVLEELGQRRVALRGDAVPLVSRSPGGECLSQATVEASSVLNTDHRARPRDSISSRMAAHEWRQPLGVLQFGVHVLRQPDLDPAQVQRTLASVDRSTQHLVELTRKLEAIARVRSNGDSPVVQTVAVATVAQEAARQLREMADAREVEISLAKLDHVDSRVGVSRWPCNSSNAINTGSDKARRQFEISGDTLRGTCADRDARQRSGTRRASPQSSSGSLVNADEAQRRI